MLKMRILIDAGVPKDSLMAASFYKKLVKRGHETFVTARKYESTAVLLEYFDVPYKEIGQYGGKTLKGKLLADLKRAIELTNYISELDKIDLVIHFANPAAARVAFGLGIPQIVLEDTPHATIVHRLTFSLATYGITPKCFPRDLLVHIIDPDRLIQYDGVDPIEWITTFSPDKQFLRMLGLNESEPIVILRPAETYAYYYLQYSSGSPLLFEEKLIKSILSAFPDTQIVVFPRYEDQKKILRDKFGERLKIPHKYIPAFNIIAYSTVVITGGGTIVEEGGLYGVPSIYFFPKKLSYAEYLKNKGLPVFHLTKPKEIIDTTLLILRDPDKYRVDAKPIISRFEKPSDKIFKLLEVLRTR